MTQRLTCRGVIAIDPRRDHVIAFFYMMNVASLRHHDARRFMSKKLRQTMSRSRWTLHRVQLRMAYAARK